MKYILSNKISSSGFFFTSFRNSIKTIGQISIHSVFMKKKKMEKFIISAAYLFFEKGNSCKMKVNFLGRIFEKFIVTKEATHPYILLIVLYSLDTKLCCYIYGIYY